MTKSLGQRINELRKNKGLTSEQFSELCGVSAVHIRRIECGNSLPSITLFITICNVLETSSDYLLGELLNKPIIPDSVEELGVKFKHLNLNKLHMINEIIDVVIKHTK